MPDIEDGNPGVSQVLDQSEHSLAFGEVEGGCGFVEHNDPGVVRKRFCDLDELRLTGGEVGNHCRWREVRADPLEVRCGVANQAPLRDVEARVLAKPVDENVFRHRQVREEADLLVNRRHTLGPQAGYPCRLWCAEHRDVPRVRTKDSADQILDRRLARAIFPGERYDFPSRNRERHASHRRNAAEGLRDVVQVDCDITRRGGFIGVWRVVQDDLFSVENAIVLDVGVCWINQS